MKKNIFCNLTVLSLLVLLMSVSSWAVPGFINYQGKLTDAGGSVLEGMYAVKFSIYTQATGGNPLWSEQQNIMVTDGIYNVKLGNASSLSIDLFDYDSIYLQVEIFKSGIGYETLSPRQALTSTAFAIKAADADTLNGQDSTDFAQSAHTHSFSEIIGTASDTQIPNTIMINYAANAGSADTVDGQHANEFATANHTHNAQYYTKSEVDSLMAELESQIAQLKTILQGVTRTGNDIEFSGVNVHIVNGTGATDGAVNGLGNLIIGYNEPSASGNSRSGSHNIVVGVNHNYSSYGGLVLGQNNSISGPYTSITD